VLSPATARPSEDDDERDLLVQITGADEELTADALRDIALHTLAAEGEATWGEQDGSTTYGRWHEGQSADVLAQLRQHLARYDAEHQGAPGVQGPASPAEFLLGVDDRSDDDAEVLDGQDGGDHHRPLVTSDPVEDAAARQAHRDDSVNSAPVLLAPEMPGEWDAEPQGDAEPLADEAAAGDHPDNFGAVETPTNEWDDLPPAPIAGGGWEHSHDAAQYDDADDNLHLNVPHDDFTGLSIDNRRPFRRSRAKRILVGGAALFVAASSLAVAAHLTGQPEPASQPKAATSVELSDWRGIALPSSTVAGPFAVTGDVVQGFSDDDLGAAIAAAQLSVRLDPAAGPTTTAATLAVSVVGATDRMARAIAEQYAASAAAEGVTDGGPLATDPGSIEGYNVARPAEGRALVHLLVAAPGGARSDFAIPLRRTDGGWSVEAASEGPFFTMQAPSGDYTPFVPQEAS